MKTYAILLMALLLVAAIVPMVLAEGEDTGGGVVIIPTEPTPECEAPVIYVDHTARGWFPNDQTINTADEYGRVIGGGKYKLGSYYDAYLLSERANYVFTGETLDYYILVSDEDGADDIGAVSLLVNNIAVSVCADVTSNMTNKDITAFQTGSSVLDTATEKVFVCKLIVQAAMTGEKAVSVKVVDGEDTDCLPINTILLGEADWMHFNPTLKLELTNGPINFGNVIAGSVATSNSVRLKNVGTDGVVMDMYIASDDYFTDPSSTNAICPLGNGIRYDQFSYYATKGSVNSGRNDNTKNGLGEEEGCTANSDEFTELPSHSGDIEDMCRIINWDKDSSLLPQGSDMSITFKLDVPDPCVGSYTVGQFHFVGRVV